MNVKRKIRNSFKRESKLLQDKPTRALVEGGNGRTSSAPPPPGAQMDTWTSSFAYAVSHIKERDLHSVGQGITVQVRTDVAK